MSQAPPSAASPSNYQAIFDDALRAYKRKTGKDLTSDPLLRSLETCNSPDAVLALLRAQILEPSQSQSSRNKFTTWLDPTVNVLNAFSETIGGFVGLAYPPVGVLFTGIGVLLSAAQGISAGRDALIDLFERIENIFRRLETYIAVPPSTGMTDAIVKVMVEVLRILGIATKEIKQNRAKKILKKLVGRTDIDDALQRLEKVTMEEAKMAAAESLKAIHGVGNQVGDKVDGALKVVEERMKGVEGMLQGVGDILLGVDGRVKDIGNQVIISVEKAERQTVNDINVASAGVRKTVQGVHNKIKSVDDVRNAVQETGASVIDGAEKISRPIASRLGNLTREWLCPPDPSVNYSVAGDSRHRGTTVWFTESSTFRDWKKSGSLLWIYGRPGSGKSVLTSAIIQDIERISEMGSGHVAYFFFDFKDTAKQDAHAFLSSVLVQLSSQSASLSDILLEFHSAHQCGSQQPSDGDLMQCLEKMLKVPSNVLYLIVDALDECPDTSGVHSSRRKVLKLVEELVRLHLPNLRLCITSRLEIEFRNVLEPLTSASNRISLHDEDGQKKDIAEYISAAVNSGKNVLGWREQDKELVVKTLTERAGGVFRWASCQIEALSRCLAAPSVRCFIEELPETLDDTYERILQEIPKSNRVLAHRVLQCLVVAVRPFRVQELSEVLAVDFSAPGEIPKPYEDWRWKDQEQAVLAACSGLIAVVNFQDFKVVQISHCSVKEFLTSDRLAATAKIDTLRYHHIRLEPAHAIVAQACIGVLLRLEYPIDRVKMSPLADYGARYFADHAELGNAISQIMDGIDHLLDQDNPRFSAWMSLISSSWREEKDSRQPKASSLYHVADLGFSGLVQYLISKRPQDVNVRGGVYGTPLHAALHRRHTHVCQLLLPHCVDVNVRDSDGRTPLHVAACNALPDFAQMIIDQGADVNARNSNNWTPLHQAIDTSPLFDDRKLDLMRILLDHGADREARNDNHYTPLYLAVCNEQLAAAKLLIEHDAIVHVRNNESWTPLHEASSRGYLDIIRLLLEHGANVDARDKDYKTSLYLAIFARQFAAARLLVEYGASLDALTAPGRTSLHEATLSGHTDIIQVILELGANLDARDNKQNMTPLHLAAGSGQFAAALLFIENGASLGALTNLNRTPLHEASWYGHVDVIRLLLERGADVDAGDNDHKTPLHLAVLTSQLAAARLLIENGASLDAQTNLNRTPLHEASWYGHVDIMRIMLGRGVDVDVGDNEHKTPLHLAILTGQFAAVRLLVENGASLDALTKHGRTPLHEASYYGRTNVIRLLLKRGANIDARDGAHIMPLHVAISTGQSAAARMLVENGASLDAQTELGRTPLHEASFYGQINVIPLLLERGAIIDAKDSAHGMTPLNVAILARQSAAARLLVENGASLDALTEHGRTSLHEASYYGRIEIMRLLLERGANVDARDYSDTTPLHLAAQNGQLAATRLLVENGASLDAQTELGRTPLHEASYYGQTNAMRLLLERGANIDARDSAHITPLHVAISTGQSAAARLLVENGASLDAQTELGRTPLHHASFCGKVDVIPILLERGAIIDAKDSAHGMTPLNVAILAGQSAAARLLVENGASLDALTEHGRTSLHEASYYGQIEIMRLLLERGANVDARDYGGTTPLHLALQNGQQAAARLLIENGANPQ